MRYHQYLSALAILFLSGCITGNASDCSKTPAMLAGDNEPTFAERYSVGIALPIGEEEFLNIVRRLGLKYSTLGPNGELPLSSPVHCRSIDMSAVDHGYRIYGGADPKSGRTESYIALVDRAKKVIYIENQYAYPAVVR